MELKCNGPCVICWPGIPESAFQLHQYLFLFRARVDPISRMIELEEEIRARIPDLEQHEFIYMKEGK